MSPSSSPSIADVAKRANVSISTVSRVINGRTVVNAKTRERVEKAISELGYQPNAFARGLMLRRSDLIGLVLPDLHGEFYSEIIRGANQQAHETGYSLVISSAQTVDESRSLLRGLHQRALVDGVAVMVSELTDSIQKVLREYRMPFVILDADIEDGAHDTVKIDQRKGTLAMMRHLIEQRGMKRVFFVGGLETNVDTQLRLQVYRETLDAHGLPYSADDVFHLDYQYDTAYEFALPRVASWAGPGCCVFAANDEMACGVIDAAATANVAVPQSLAVVGFDDTRIARMTRPQLTTVHAPMAEMGAKAVELLCERLKDPDTPPQCISLHPELVVRQSCGENLTPA